MEIVNFEWDEGNISHIGYHSVWPDEVEEVAFDDKPWIKKGRQGTRYLLGHTVGGRYLFVVYSLKVSGLARVITAMDMDDTTKRLYKKKGK